MARATKIGIDYFSHDVHMSGDRKIRLIRAKYGLLGYAIYLRLLEELYQDKGYYISVDEEFNLLFCDDNNLDVNVYNQVLNDCINYKLFNIKHYNTYNILTSKRIQENYLSAVDRRKSVDIDKRYYLLNVDINSLNVDINFLNVDIGTQSKVKNSKVKNSKVNIYRKFAHLKLTTEEFERLIEDGYKVKDIDDKLDDIENYKKNTSYVSLNLTIRKWFKKEEKEKKEKITTNNNDTIMTPEDL
jgi:hypothetical protein